MAMVSNKDSISLHLLFLKIMILFYLQIKETTTKNDINYKISKMKRGAMKTFFNIFNFNYIKSIHMMEIISIKKNSC
jgi:hypothetical protein